MKIMLEKLIVILGLMLLAHSVTSQEEANARDNGWGFEVGWRQLLLADRHASPLLYQALAEATEGDTLQGGTLASMLRLGPIKHGILASGQESWKGLLIFTVRRKALM